MAFQHKIVRDLAWVVSSPSLFGFSIAPPRKWSQELVRQARPWLLELDSSPAATLAWLALRLRGDYVATLLEYWVEESPILDSSNLQLRRQLGVEGSREVRGMLRYIFEAADLTNSPERRWFHWEASYKIFLSLELTEARGDDERHLSQLVSFNLDCNALHHLNVMQQKRQIPQLSPRVRHWVETECFAANSSAATSVAKDTHCTVPGVVHGLYAVTLNQTNISDNSNTNKFFIIQLIEGGGRFTVFSRWGRVGDVGQKEEEKAQFSNLDPAIKAFESKFRSKTGNIWSPPHTDFVAKPQKYQIVEMATGALVSLGLPPSEHWPLGRLSEHQLQKGHALLEKVGRVMKKGASEEAEADYLRTHELLQLSSSFYTLIPHDFGQRSCKMTRESRPVLIDSPELLEQKFALLTTLDQAEVAQSNISSGVRSSAPHELMGWAFIKGSVLQKWPSTASASPRGDGWWTDDPAMLLSMNQDSLFAVVDQRHLLAPARAAFCADVGVGVTRGLYGHNAMVIPCTPVAPPSAAEHGGSLRRGDRGGHIQQLQFCLIQLGYMAPAAIRNRSGYFAHYTEEAILRVRHQHSQPAALPPPQRTPGIPKSPHLNARQLGALTNCIDSNQAHGSASAGEDGFDEHHLQSVRTSSSRCTNIILKVYDQQCEQYLRQDFEQQQRTRDAPSSPTAPPALDAPSSPTAPPALDASSSPTAPPALDATTAGAGVSAGAGAGAISDVDCLHERVDSQGRILAIQGCLELLIPAAPLLSASELHSQVTHLFESRLSGGDEKQGTTQWRRSKSGSGGDSATAPASSTAPATAPALPLTVIELRFFDQGEDDSKSDGDNGNADRKREGRGAEACVGRWQEVSRGCIVPPGWEAAARELAPPSLPAAGAFTAAGKRRLCEGKGGHIVTTMASMKGGDKKKEQGVGHENCGGGSGSEPTTSSLANFVVLDDAKRAKKTAAPRWLPPTINTGSVFVDALDHAAGNGKRWTIDQAVRSLSAVEEAGRAMLIADTIVSCCGRYGKHAKRVVQKGALRDEEVGNVVQAEDSKDVQQTEQETREQEMGLSLAKGYLLLSAFERMSSSKSWLNSTQPALAPACRYVGRMRSKQPLRNELIFRFLFAQNTGVQLRPCRLLLKCLSALDNGDIRGDARGDAARAQQQQEEKQAQQLMLVGLELQQLLSACKDSNHCELDSNHCDMDSRIELGHRLAIALGIFREFRLGLASYASERELASCLCWLVRNHCSCTKMPLDAAADMLGLVQAQDPQQHQRLSKLLLDECREGGFTTKKINRVRGELGMPEELAPAREELLLSLGMSRGRRSCQGPLPALCFAEQGVPIMYVDSLEQLAALEEEVRSSCARAGANASHEGVFGQFAVLGMDVEWEPENRCKSGSKSSPNAKQHPASIVQLAAPHVVLIIDIIRLSAGSTVPSARSASAVSAIASFFATVFAISIIIGFGLETDIRKLQTSFSPALECFNRLPRVVDLRRCAVEHRAQPNAGKLSCMSNKSLSSLVEDFVGKSLDKEQQLSHWGERPLCQDQLDYAALDAHVLLQIAARAWANKGDKGEGIGETETEDIPHSMMHHATASITEALLLKLQSTAVPLELASAPPMRALSKRSSVEGGTSEVLQPLGTNDVLVALRALGLFRERMVRDISNARSLGDSTLADNSAVRIVKTLILVVDSPCESIPLLVACVLPLTRQLRMESVRTALREVLKAASTIRLCKHNELVPLCGYPHGAIGPVGLRNTPVAVLLDDSIMASDEILCGAGAPDIVFAVSPHALMAKARAQQAAISIVSDGPTAHQDRSDGPTVHQDTPFLV
jgi:prolyl-tRNA editing enzyme YbaK/EbsC (Cys-tRNA(Pro) deacylase)/predicted DNA-binding WGR domain protein